MTSNELAQAQFRATIYCCNVGRNKLAQFRQKRVLTVPAESGCRNLLNCFIECLLPALPELRKLVPAYDSLQPCTTEKAQACSGLRLADPDSDLRLSIIRVLC